AARPHRVRAPPHCLCASASVPSARKWLRVGTPLFPLIAVPSPRPCYCPRPVSASPLRSLRPSVPPRVHPAAAPSRGLPRLCRAARSAHPSPSRQSPVHWHRRPIPHPPTPLRALLSAHLCRSASIAQLYPPPVPVLLPDSGAVKPPARCRVASLMRRAPAMPSPRISTVYALPTAPTLAAARVDRTAVSLPVAPPLALCPHR
ncbi:hypothetical protein B0H14DRAFT_2747522, partial [Mycena olivaceomarginata]